MRRRSSGAIEVVELAYRVACSEPDRWLQSVATEAVSLLDVGGDVFAYEYDTTRPLAGWPDRPFVARGDPGIADAVLGTFRDTPLELNERIHQRAGMVTILSELIGQNATEHSSIGPHAVKSNVGDMLGLNAADPSGRGTFFCATAPRRIQLDPLRARRLELVAAHLASAGRLRTVLASHPLPEAVLAANGKVVHATSSSEASLPALTRAARDIDRARARRAESESLESWRALVDGRWSLVDVVERDGKRFLFAHANSPRAPDPRRLTSMERVIAGFVALGHGNKLIAYELGLTNGAVGRYVHDVFKKIGVRTRVELIDRYVQLTRGEANEVQVAGERLSVVVSTEPSFDAVVALTRSERAVANLAARGMSNAEIARTRETTPRTIANQLASIFKKLGIQSRSELRLVATRSDRA